jgi:neutral ceramidase
MKFFNHIGRCSIVVSLLTVSLLLAQAARAATADSGSLRVGAAQVDFTSLVKAELPPTGKYQHEHIFVRAIVLDNGATRAAIIGSDMAHLLEGIYQPVATQVAAELNCPKENIIISATHTHSGGMPDGNPGAEDPWVKQYVGKVVEAVRQAKSQLQPARVGFGTGTANLNVNRDAVSPESHLWTQAPNLRAYSDKTVSVLKFVKPSGEPIAVYVNYAMHAIDGYLVGFISADFPGAMCNYVQEAFGSKPVVVFSQSASGDQNPLYLRPSTNLLASRSGVPITGDDVVREPVEEPIRDKKVAAREPDAEVRNRLEHFIDAEGAVLGEEVIRVMTLTTKTSDNVRIWGAQKTVSCPGRKRTDAGREGMAGTYADSDPVNIRLGVIGIDNVALTTVNAEIYSRILLHLKSETPMTDTVLVTIANGRSDSGYIPDDESYGHNSFQVLGSRLKQGCAETSIADGLTDLVSQYARGGK